MIPFWEGLYGQLKTHVLLALDPDRFLLGVARKAPVSGPFP